MPSKPETVINNVRILPPNHRSRILAFKDWLENEGSSERNNINYLKVLILFSKEIGSKDFEKVTKEDIVNFLDKRKKSQEADPEKKWIETWNHYFNRLVTFYRWLYNKGKIIDNMETKIILGLEEQAAETARMVLNLSDQETSKLKSFNKGHALFLTKNHRIHAKFEPTTQEKEMFDTTPTE